MTKCLIPVLVLMTMSQTALLQERVYDLPVMVLTAGAPTKAESVLYQSELSLKDLKARAVALGGSAKQYPIGLVISLHDPFRLDAFRRSTQVLREIKSLLESGDGWVSTARLSADAKAYLDESFVSNLPKGVQADIERRNNIFSFFLQVGGSAVLSHDQQELFAFLRFGKPADNSSQIKQSQEILTEQAEEPQSKHAHREWESAYQVNFNGFRKRDRVELNAKALADVNDEMSRLKIERDAALADLLSVVSEKPVERGTMFQDLNPKLQQKILDDLKFHGTAKTAAELRDFSVNVSYSVKASVKWRRRDGTVAGMTGGLGT